MSIQLNIYQTLAAAMVVYYAGVFLRMKISALRTYCIPAPVIGGILFAALNCLLYTQGIWTYEQDAVMQNVCMMLFFYQRRLYGQSESDPPRRHHGV